MLIAVDTAGRVLELAQLLDQIWRTKDAGLGVYSLALLNNVSYNVVEFSKSQVEWMSDKLMRCFEDKRNNPFQFRHLSLCHGLSDLARVPSPKVVLASQPDLECGFSRDLFIQWCQDPKNSIILTYRTTPGTLARFLIDNPSEKITEIELRKRVKLEGKELEEYLEKEKLKKEAAKKLEQSKEADIDSSDESDIEEDIDQPSAHKTKHDLMMKGEGSRKGSFFKQAKKSYPMFPAPEERIKWDEYGEIIKYVSKTNFSLLRIGGINCVIIFQFMNLIFLVTCTWLASEYLRLKTQKTCNLKHKNRDAEKHREY